jgi:hypothetical protein
MVDFDRFVAYGHSYHYVIDNLKYPLGLEKNPELTGIEPVAFGTNCLS